MMVLYVFAGLIVYVLMGGFSVRVFDVVVGTDFLDDDEGTINSLRWVFVFTWPLWWAGMVLTVLFKYFILLPVKLIAKI